VFKTNPWAVSLLIALVAVCIAWGGLIDRRIHDRALAAWNTEWRVRRADWFKSRLRRRVVITIVMLAVAVLVATGGGYAALNPDLSACKPAPADQIDFGYALCMVITQAVTASSTDSSRSSPADRDRQRHLAVRVPALLQRGDGCPRGEAGIRASPCATDAGIH